MDNVIEWLNSSPLESELKMKDGAWFIPYHIIVEKLNRLTDFTWSMKNFHHVYQHVNRGKYIVSGSVEVEVQYRVVTLWRNDEALDYHIVKRTLSGAATFLINGEKNPHVAATCKSLAVNNAVKPLGKQFGWGLNGWDSESPLAPDQTETMVNEDVDGGDLSKEIAEAEFMLKAIKNKEDAQEYINKTALKHHSAIREIINSKPNKTT